MTYLEPIWYPIALKERGVLEGYGDANNPVVQQYYRDAGHPEIRHDSVPWCAAFVGAMLHRAGIKPSGSLMARSYLQWGQRLERPKKGCITIISRGASTWTGHVFFWVQPGYGLGGNQRDKVSIAPYNPARTLGYRWPIDYRREI
jgi:uncharacterized protein (TIGR02594 family)